MDLVIDLSLAVDKELSISDIIGFFFCVCEIDGF